MVLFLFIVYFIPSLSLRGISPEPLPCRGASPEPLSLRGASRRRATKQSLPINSALNGGIAALGRSAPSLAMTKNRFLAMTIFGFYITAIVFCGRIKALKLTKKSLQLISAKSPKTLLSKAFQKCSFPR